MHHPCTSRAGPAGFPRSMYTVTKKSASSRTPTPSPPRDAAPGCARSAVRADAGARLRGQRGRVMHSGCVSEARRRQRVSAGHRSLITVYIERRARRASEMCTDRRPHSGGVRRTPICWGAYAAHRQRPRRHKKSVSCGHLRVVCLSVHISRGPYGLPRSMYTVTKKSASCRTPPALAGRLRRRSASDRVPSGSCAGSIRRSADRRQRARYQDAYT